MVVKSISTTSHAEDLVESFVDIRKYNMRLNLEKHIFRVQGGNFPSFMLTHRGIKANLEKCSTIIEMKSLNTLKEVQRLSGRLATLSRFLPRDADTTKPFFKLLKKQERIEWNEECEAYF